MIQAFEFTNKLSWLLLKDFLVYQRVSDISGSRDAVREAVRNPGSAAGTPPGRAKLISIHKSVEKIMLYGSRALGRQREGSDIDLFLVAPSINLRELLELGAALDDLLLPWKIDLQLRHLIAHEGLLAHIERSYPFGQ